jgi:hypothetical protein
MADLPRTIVKESNLHYDGVYGKSYTFLYNYTLKEVKDIIEYFNNHFINERNVVNSERYLLLFFL